MNSFTSPKTRNVMGLGLAATRDIVSFFGAMKKRMRETLRMCWLARSTAPSVSAPHKAADIYTTSFV